MSTIVRRVSSRWLLFLLTTLFGFLTGSWISLSTPLLSSVVGLARLPTASRARNLLHGLSGLAAPHLFGLVADRAAVVYITGGIMAVAAVIYAAAFWVGWRRRPGYQEIGT